LAARPAVPFAGPVPQIAHQELHRRFLARRKQEGGAPTDF
jgi:hypothetical protein